MIDAVNYLAKLGWELILAYPVTPTQGMSKDPVYHYILCKKVPANNFMGQEPGSNEEIAQFCSLKYDVTFPMMAKISVKGKNMAPLYQWLTEKKLNGKEDAPVQWNFQKFMIDENGNWVGFVAPKESPLSEKIVTWIEQE